jgi:hypothetical protein
MKMKRLVATVAMASAITAGTAGLAYAQDGSGGSGSGQPSATTPRRQRLRLAVRRHAGKIVSDTLGVTTDELRAALRGGQTIDAYARSLGKDPQSVKDALVQAANQALDRAATNGRIDSARAAELEGKVPARVDKLMEHQFGQGRAA